MNSLLPGHHVPTQVINPFLSLDDMAALKVTSKSVKAQVELFPKERLKMLLNEYWKDSRLLWCSQRARNVLELRDLRPQVNTKVELKLIAGDFMTGFIAGAGDFIRITSLVMFIFGAADMPWLFYAYLDKKRISVFTGLWTSDGSRACIGVGETCLAPIVYKATAVAQTWLLKKRGLVINFSILNKDSLKNIPEIRVWSSFALIPAFWMVSMLDSVYDSSTGSISPDPKSSRFKIFCSVFLICGIAGALFGMGSRRSKLEFLKRELFDEVWCRP